MSPEIQVLTATRVEYDGHTWTVNDASVEPAGRSTFKRWPEAYYLRLHRHEWDPKKGKQRTRYTQVEWTSDDACPVVFSH